MGVLVGAAVLGWVGFALVTALPVGAAPSAPRADATLLPVVPNPEPARAIDWAVEAWVGDAVRLRSTAPLSDAASARLERLYADALALFPSFAGVEPRPAEPLDLRLVDRSLLNDPTYIDLAEPRTVLGVYFGGARRIAYVTPAAGNDDRVVLHEIAHYLFDMYELSLEPYDEEERVDRFVRWVRGLERTLSRSHVAVTQVGDRWPVYVLGSGVPVRAREAPSLTRLLWLDRLVSAGADVVARRLGREVSADLQLRLHASARCHASARPDAPVIDVWLDGCGEATRAMQQLGHALGHRLLAAESLAPLDEERLAYGLGRAIEHELRARRLPWWEMY